MKTLLLFMIIFSPSHYEFGDNHFLIPANANLFENSQIVAKEVEFEVDAKTNKSIVMLRQNSYLSIDCEELILKGDIIFKNAEPGENTSGVKIEILYKKLSGPGKIVNGFDGYKGGVSFILKSK